MANYEELNETFFVRSQDQSEYSFFWDIIVNTKRLRGFCIGIMGAHRSLNCEKNCARDLPQREDFERLKNLAMFIIQSHNPCDETDEEFGDLHLQCLLFYNEYYRATMEVASRHQHM